MISMLIMTLLRLIFASMNLGNYQVFTYPFLLARLFIFLSISIVVIDFCVLSADFAAMEKSNKDQVWYFFSRRDLKYPKSQRANRATKAGYWKSTGKDRQIKARRTKEEIGTKKTLVFHEGRLPGGVKTNWIIHEYKAKTILPHQVGTYYCYRFISIALTSL